MDIFNYQNSNPNNFFSTNSQLEKNTSLHREPNTISSKPMTACKKFNFTNFIEATGNKSYLPISGCVFAHILSSHELWLCCVNRIFHKFPLSL